MSFYRAFIRGLFWKPRPALAALYWHVTGRRQRARNRLRLGAAEAPHAYQVWIATVERRRSALAAAPDQIARWPHRPTLSVLMFQQPGQRLAQFHRVVAALEAQVYTDWEMVLVQARNAPPPRVLNVPRQILAMRRTDNAARALNLALAEATGDYILPLADDAVLAPDALFNLAASLQNAPDATLLYGDEDEIDARGRRSKNWFKPGWNRELLLGQDYVSGACLIATAAARAAPPVAQDMAMAAAYALVLDVTQADGAQVVHVPKVLCHRAQGTNAAAARQDARIAAVSRIVAPQAATASAGPHGTVQVRWPLPDPAPLVSVIIPTRDQPRLLRTCVSGLLNATSYRNIEVLIVDNGSRDAEALDYLRRVARNPLVRVLRQDTPFNYAALNNYAAQEARGTYLCLLNNDIEIIAEHWLTTLMRQAVRPQVGAVGARLLYGDGTIQHAGVTVGLGAAAGHAHRFQRDTEAGYFARAHATHYVTAVTGACMVMERRKFLGIDGFDARNFAVAFNDVDLCLKLRDAGWINVYEPQAVLIHHESKSRGRDTRPGQIERYRAELAALQTRWGTQQFRDPLHHPHFDRSSERYILQL